MNIPCTPRKSPRDVALADLGGIGATHGSLHVRPESSISRNVRRRIVGIWICAVALGVVACDGDESATPSGDHSEAGGDDSDSDCLPVSPAKERTITRRLNYEVVGMPPIEAAAVKSSDSEAMYFIAMEFDPTGHDDQTGVWAASSLNPEEGILMAVDGVAQEFSLFPAADETYAEVGEADPSVEAAKDCLN